MNDLDKSLIYSESVKAGKRIYYFDVKQTRNGDKYVAITESKKIVEGTQENPHFSFEKHKLFLYKEDYDKFLTALMKAIEVTKQGGTDAPAQVEEDAPADEAASEVEPQAESAGLNVELDF